MADGVVELVIGESGVEAMVVVNDDVPDSEK